MELKMVTVVPSYGLSPLPLSPLSLLSSPHAAASNEIVSTVAMVAKRRCDAMLNSPSGKCRVRDALDGM